MLRKPFLLPLVIFSVLVLGVTGATAQQPQAELAATADGCVAGGSYDPACDVDHNGDMNVTDLELVASHFGQIGTWTASGYWTQSGSDVYYDAGDVGIGTSSPSARLDVDAGGKGTGLRVSSAINHGVVVRNPGEIGVRVESTGDDGVWIYEAAFSGVHVASAGRDGVLVQYAGDNGIQVGLPDQDTTSDGVEVNNPDDEGVDVDGAGNNGIGITNSTDWDILAYGDVRILGACNCKTAAFGQNVGATALEPGDIVAVRGVAHPELGQAPVVVEVSQAAGSDGIIGVVAGRAELDKASDEPGLVPREGPAQPGDYVNIITGGLAQVKASALTAPIQEGARLTAAAETGYARPVKTVAVQGVQIAENTPILGVALESLEAGQDAIWVLVNPR
jgi:hypothetical protein